MSRDDDVLPLVSIVTPSLDQGRFIEETIRSVLAQDYPRIEHIVVDGGSTDGTLEVLRRYDHLRWVSEPDEGQADAVNKGFGMASGSIFGWLNADDTYLPGAVRTAVEALEESGCGMVHGSWRQIDEDGGVIRDVRVGPFDYALQLDVRNAVAQPTVFFTREAWERVGGLDASYRYAMDYELWLRLAKHVEVTRVDDVLATYRYHPESKSVADYERFYAETRRASRTHGGRFFSPLLLDWHLPRSHPWLFRGVLTWRLLRRGEIAEIPRRGLALARRGGRRQS